MKIRDPEIRVLESVHDIAKEAAELFFAIARVSVEERRRFTVVLSGGGTPRVVNEEIVARHAGRVDWAQVFIFFGDERCVSPDHPESNYRMARESLIEKVPVPPRQVHRISAERPPRTAATDYEQRLRKFFPPTVDLPVFDLIFLGMGDDGHTASLFPGTPALRENRRWVVENRVEQLKTDRVTMTFPVINQARNVIFLVAGSSKASALKQVLEGPFQPELYPAQRVQPEGRLTWLVDRAAAEKLGRK